MRPGDVSMAAVREPIPRLERDLAAALEAVGFFVAGLGDADVLVWAIEPDGGLEALRAGPAVPVVALLDRPPERSLRAYFAAGAHAVLGRGSTPTVIAAAALLVVRGHAVMPFSRAALDQRDVGDSPALLDRTELRWMRALASGTATAALATVEGYSERDLYRRLRLVYEKLGVSGRTDALLLLAEADLLHQREASDRPPSGSNPQLGAPAADPRGRWQTRDRATSPSRRSTP